MVISDVIMQGMPEITIRLPCAGMTRPTKVIKFLDVWSPSWDPSLAFVMGGAILIALPAFQYIIPSMKKRWGAPLCATGFDMPTIHKIDVRLILGGLLFGSGWGLGGMCPGPALIALVNPSRQLLGFLLGMAGGFWGHEWAEACSAIVYIPVAVRSLQLDH